MADGGSREEPLEETLKDLPSLHADAQNGRWDPSQLVLSDRAGQSLRICIRSELVMNGATSEQRKRGLTRPSGSDSHANSRTGISDLLEAFAYVVSGRW